MLLNRFRKYIFFVLERLIPKSGNLVLYYYVGLCISILQKSRYGRVTSPKFGHPALSWEFYNHALNTMFVAGACRRYATK